MSENIILDLKQAGSGDLGNLLDMLNNYRVRSENAVEEIDKLKQLEVIKNDEISNLDVELESLRDFMGKKAGMQEEEIGSLTHKIKLNSNDIRRQDKLIVDLQQKNEISQN